MSEKMMAIADLLTLEDVRCMTAEFAATNYPGKTVDEVLGIALSVVGIRPIDALAEQMTRQQFREILQTAYLCDHEYHLGCDGEEFDSDPKFDMGFWRTGIRVSPLGRRGQA